MTKSEMADLLAANEYSVQIGMQTHRYWFNVYMKMRKAQLEMRLEAATEPDPQKSRALLLQSDKAR